MSNSNKVRQGRASSKGGLFVVGAGDPEDNNMGDEGSRLRSSPKMAKPAYQARSRRRHEDLIAAGLKLLQTRDFDDLPVSVIVAEAGCAVGSFYTRFEDKDAYFAALQLHVLEKMRVRSHDWFERQAWETAPAGELISLLVHWLTGVFVEHRGLVRAAHRHGASQPGVWSPMRALGQAWGFEACELIAPRLTQLPEPVRRKEFMIAMQFCYGTLVNSVINDPSPLKLNDPALPGALTWAFRGYLQEAANSY